MVRIRPIFAFVVFFTYTIGGSVASSQKVQSDWTKKALARTISPPLGLPKLSHPKENPPSLAKVQLGRKIFFDKRLSQNEGMSCATCHVPEEGFTQNDRATPEGMAGQTVRRNAPGLLNVAYYERFFHDGRETALETQYILPLTAPNEMANPSVGFVVQKIKWFDDYAGLFEKAFGKGPSADRIGEALAVYQRTLLAGASRFDRWYFGGDKSALSTLEIEGFKLFTGRAKCALCHQIGEKNAIFTDNAFHDIGHGWEREKKRLDNPQNTSERDLGRFEVTQNPYDRWRYRTPTLRNIELTAPYMHDGAFKTLENVIDFYDKGGKPHPGQDVRIIKLNLTDRERQALVAFLKSLTGNNIDELIAEARSP